MKILLNSGHIHRAGGATGSPGSALYPSHTTRDPLPPAVLRHLLENYASSLDASPRYALPFVEDVGYVVVYEQAEEVICGSFSLVALFGDEDPSNWVFEDDGEIFKDDEGEEWLSTLVALNNGVAVGVLCRCSIFNEAVGALEDTINENGEDRDDD